MEKKTLDIEEYNEEEIDISDINIDDSVKLYVKEISKYNILDKEEQQKLIKEYQATGDINLKNKIVNHNLRLSFLVAKKYISICQSMEFLDLIQECNITLFDVIDKFDLSKNFEFSTYAVKAMERNILRQIDNKDKNIRKPVHVEIINSKYNKYVREYYEENRCYPSDEEIKIALDISDEKLYNQRNLMLLNTESLNKRIETNNEEGDQLEDFITFQEKGYSSYDSFIDSQIILKAAQTALKNREYYIIYERILNRRTLESIAKEFKFTRERVRQIEKIALKKLRINLKKYENQITEQYSIKELEKLHLKPLSPKEIATYYFIKQNIDEIKYYFLYTKRENKYDINDYKMELNFLSEKEIKQQLDSCTDIEELFTTKNCKFLDSILEKYTPTEMFDLDISPISSKKIKNYYLNDGVKSKLLLKKGLK